MDLKQQICKICKGSSCLEELIVREMMFGKRTKFSYGHCTICNGLQLNEVPKDLQNYYPSEDYYAFKKDSIFIKFLKKIRDNVSYKKNGIVYKILESLFLLNYPLISIANLNLKKNSIILDVGCGNGELLKTLHKLGYENLTGIDSYINYKKTNPFPILKTTIENLVKDKKYDLIMFHHSFEHLENPIETLLVAKKLLNHNGVIIIRTPIVAMAFKEYENNWFQIDAPRHFFIYSIQSMNIILSKVDLKMKNMYCDSTVDQFYWSECYKNNISMSEVLEKQNILKLIISRFFSSHYKIWKKNVIEFNKNNVGDSGCFYIQSD